MRNCIYSNSAVAGALSTRGGCRKWVRREEWGQF